MHVIHIHLICCISASSSHINCHRQNAFKIIEISPSYVVFPSKKWFPFAYELVSFGSARQPKKACCANVSYLLRGRSCFEGYAPQRRRLDFFVSRAIVGESWASVREKSNNGNSYGWFGDEVWGFWLGLGNATQGDTKMKLKWWVFSLNYLWAKNISQKNQQIVFCVTQKVKKK